MFGLLTILPSLKGGCQADAVAMMPEGPDPERPSTEEARCVERGLKCLLAAPWGRLILGDDLVPVALLLVFVVLLLLPILGVGLGLLLLAVMALLRAWLWCHRSRHDKSL